MLVNWLISPYSPLYRRQGLDILPMGRAKQDMIFQCISTYFHIPVTQFTTILVCNLASLDLAICSVSASLPVICSSRRLASSKQLSAFYTIFGSLLDWIGSDMMWPVRSAVDLLTGRKVQEFSTAMTTFGRNNCEVTASNKQHGRKHPRPVGSWRSYDGTYYTY